MSSRVDLSTGSVEEAADSLDHALDEVLSHVGVEWQGDDLVDDAVGDAEVPAARVAEVRVLVDRHEVDPRLDVAPPQMVDELSAAAVQDPQAVDERADVHKVRPRRSHPFEAAEGLVVAPASPLPRRDELLGARDLREAHARRDVVQVVAEARADDVVLPAAAVLVPREGVLVHAELAHVAKALLLGLGADDDAAAVDRGDDLHGVEAEAGDVPVRADPPSTDARAEGMAGILDDTETAPLRQLEDPLLVAR